MRQRLPAGFTMFCHNIGKYAATYIKPGGQAHESWLGSCYQVIEDAVGDGFVKTAFIPERPDIQLEALEFHAFLVRDIVQGEHGKIRLTSFRAQACEFGDFHVDMKITC